MINSSIGAVRKFAFFSLAPVLIPISVALLAVAVSTIVKSGLPAIFWYAWFVSTLAMLFLWLRRGRVLKTSESEGLVSVRPDPSWGRSQKEVFEELAPFVSNLVSSEAGVKELPSQALSVFRQVAKRLGRKGEFAEYEITIPEILLMLETLASQYRSILRAQVPLIDTVNVSHALLLHKHQSKLEYGAKWLGRAKMVYRGWRLSTPGGVISELRDRVFGPLVDDSMKNLSLSLRRDFLMDVARVSIDLYGGSFRTAIEELPNSTLYALDERRMAGAVEPIRIVVVGQVSSGKSTLMNALLDEVKAEVGMLPVTNQVSVYEYVLGDGSATRLVDTPGIGSGGQPNSVALNEALAADIIIWLMRADQQAKRADQEAYRFLDEYFSKEENKLRKRPTILGVISHADRLRDFSAGKGLAPQAEASLVSYCAQYVPAIDWQVCTLDGDQFGISEVKKHIADLRDEAVNTLLNRRRNDMSKSRVSLADLKRFGRGVKSAAKGALPPNKVS